MRVLRRIGWVGLAASGVAALVGLVLAAGSALAAGDWDLAPMPWIGIAMTLIVAGLAGGASFGLLLDVVERVAWVDGIEYPTTATVDPLADDADLTLADLRRDATIASATLPASSYPLLEVLVRPETIARIDPAIAAAAGALAPDAVVWLVRGLHDRGDPTQIDWRIVARDGGRVIASGSIQTTRSPGAG